MFADKAVRNFRRPENKVASPFGADFLTGGGASMTHFGWPATAVPGLPGRHSRPGLEDERLFALNLA